jgi:hypothetical protein
LKDWDIILADLLAQRPTNVTRLARALRAQTVIPGAIREELATALETGRLAFWASESKRLTGVERPNVERWAYDRYKRHMDAKGPGGWEAARETDSRTPSRGEWAREKTSADLETELRIQCAPNSIKRIITKINAEK